MNEDRIRENASEVREAIGGEVSIDRFDTQSGTSYGHSAAEGAMSIGAAAYFETPAFGTNPPLLEPFSARGNVPILFRTDGSAIDPSQGSWATCEAHEWYETESIPEDVECPGS